MGKIGIIASTEFAAAVRTKAFLVGIFLMPLLMIGSIVLQTVVADRVDTKPRRFAVVDRSGVLYPTIRAVAAVWNDAVEGKSKLDDPRLAIHDRQEAQLGRAPLRALARRRGGPFPRRAPTGALRPHPPGRALRLRRDSRRASSTRSGRPTPGSSITPTARTTTP